MTDHIFDRLCVGTTIRWTVSNTPSMTVKTSTNVACGLGHAFGSSLQLLIT